LFDQVKTGFEKTFSPENVQQAQDKLTEFGGKVKVSCIIFDEKILFFLNFIFL
jgi:hypothetical protein